MAIARQPSLLDLDDRPSHDAGFADLRHVALDRGAWVDVVPGWVTGHEALFETVLAAADWQVWTRSMFDRVVEQPRLSTSWADTALPPALWAVREMAVSLSARYGQRLTRISANLYRDGSDSVAWHGDTHLRTLPTATVAVLSLGHARPFRRSTRCRRSPRPARGSA